MTEEEFEKARQEDAWLVLDRADFDTKLVRARRHGWEIWRQPGERLRLATPNDMLKYEPFVLPRIEGCHYDIVICDDVCNTENTTTEYSREKMREWLAREVKGK